MGISIYLWVCVSHTHTWTHTEHNHSKNRSFAVKVTVQVLIQQQQQQTNRPVSLLMHTESEISWALVNTKHAIEESSSDVRHSCRQLLHGNGMVMVHCRNKLLSPGNCYCGNFVHTCESCNDDSGMFVYYVSMFYLRQLWQWHILIYLGKAHSAPVWL